MEAELSLVTEISSPRDTYFRVLHFLQCQLSLQNLQDERVHAEYMLKVGALTSLIAMIDRLVASIE